MFAYEYVLTIDQEVRLIWMRKKTGASVLFLLIRYHALAVQVFMNAASYAAVSNEHLSEVADRDIGQICSVYIKVQSGVDCAQFLTWAVFSSLRVLAVSDWNWLLASLVFILSSTPFVINVVRYIFSIITAKLSNRSDDFKWSMSFGVVGHNLPIVGCVGSMSMPLRDANMYVTMLARRAFY
ncbi:hypothetical protein FKP32DRAFT_1600818 [Trametes sanguinea]|nr:hypothetical protein FKP32DRAFT_1600818 [Trametes sanguinea]